MKNTTNTTEQLNTLTLYVKTFINSLKHCNNVDTDSKQILLGNKIDVSSSWESNESRTFSSGLKNSIDSEREFFYVYNKTAKLTQFNLGRITYEDLDSKTTLVFENSKLEKVSIQQTGAPNIPLNDQQIEKFLETLEISKNLVSMLNIVSDTNDKLKKLEAEKIQVNIDNATNSRAIMDQLIQKTLDNIMKIKLNQNSTQIETNKPRL